MALIQQQGGTAVLSTIVSGPVLLQKAVRNLASDGPVAAGQPHGYVHSSFEQVHQDTKALLALIQQTREGLNGKKNRAGAFPSDRDLAALTSTAQGLANKLQSIRNHRHRSRRTRNSNSRAADSSAQSFQRNRHTETTVGGALLLLSPSSSRSKPTTTDTSTSSRHSPCEDCNRTKTPEWRAGPTGPEALCNVCGLLYAKRMLRLQGHK
ncbi:hypothetical protein PG993_010210 [Apiospora rasikravindrae]|uniref:GATA-type domain-containing protein n=1 Tax=Apiospora rasikravindrae TaxID=990691 RepID=A0ABR1SLK2_9PEZI